MTNLTALYDANVLYPAPLRDLLIYLALTNLFRARWTNYIHDEWMRNVQKNRPELSSKQLERTRQLMNNAVEDCLITGYESLIPALSLSDPDDRHVLAAAIAGRADVIVTYNLRDFPADVLELYGIEAQHPDVFIARLLDLDAGSVLKAVKEQRANLRRPPVSAEALITTFEQLSLPQTALRLREFVDLI